MPDGTRLAVDVWLPRDHERRPGPTILRQTRYFRRVARRRAGSLLPADQFDLYHATRARFLAEGYAWVDVDVRGTGASFGAWWLPWSPDEGRDGASVVSWIASQSWSNGQVGLVGISYDGTTAEQTAAEGHPAVKALAARYSVWDVYADIAFPGGLFHEEFLRAWSGLNERLDRHELSAAGALLVQMSALGLAESALSPLGQRLLRALRLHEPARGPSLERLFARLVDGVVPVDDDPRGEARARSLDDRHRNFDVYAGARRIRHRDDSGFFAADPSVVVDTFSPHRRRAALERTGIPILSESGWFDGAYGRAAIDRFQQIRTPGSRLLLGPWDHGGRQHVGPFGRAKPSTFDHADELLTFFDESLARTPRRSPTVRYWQYGDDAWQTASSWPLPTEPSAWYLGPAGTLAKQPSAAGGHDVYVVDPTLGSGRTSRWRSLVGLTLPTGYDDRREKGSRHLVFASAPLERDVVLVGSPTLRLRIAADATDAAVFAYVEVEDRSGRIALLSEGWLRLSLRGAGGAAPTFTAASRRSLVPGELVDVMLSLLPIAVRLSAGSRLRLALAGADADHFEAPTDARALTIAHAGSVLSLPITR